MKFKKNLIAGAIAACIAPAAYAEIELGSGLSVTGFLDMSSVYVDADGAPNTARSSGIDQFETDFLFSGSMGVSAEVDIEYGGTTGTSETFVEQAFVTKSFSDKFSLKVGRFLSYTGWETEEPTGLFQYSGVGYASSFYGYYQQGVSAYYDGGTVDFMASVVNSAFDPTDTNSDPETEIGIAISPSEAFTAKLFLIQEDEDDYTNFWLSYKVGKMTFAAEYVDRDLDVGNADGDGYLFMANYASGSFGFTARYHDWSLDNGFENDGLTLSPSYKVGDNLLLVGEYRMDSFGDDDVDTLAFEALFMF